jgi:microcystin-dependent protein
MSEPFLGEIRATSFEFAPRGWALCAGQLMAISQNQALFAILGTTYGGDGRVTFGLPDLRGRAPMHFSAAHTLGERGGEEYHTLTPSEMPRHDHDFNATSAGANSNVAAGGTPAAAVAGSPLMYAGPGAMTPLNPGAIGASGGNQPHNNIQPSLVLNFIIALQGIFPSQN